MYILIFQLPVLIESFMIGMLYMYISYNHILFCYDLFMTFVYSIGFLLWGTVSV